MDAARTPEMLAAAQFDNVTEDASIFTAAIGRGFDLALLPATARLMQEVRTAEKDAAGRAKEYFVATGHG